MILRTVILFAAFWCCCVTLGAVETDTPPVGADRLPPAIADVAGVARKIQVIYHIPKDRAPAANYQAKIEVMLAFVADLYRRDLAAKGLACEGPAFEWDTAANRVRIRIVNGANNADQYGGANRTGDAFQLVAADVDAQVGSFNNLFQLVLTENWDPTAPASTYWTGDVALGANWGADGGRGLFSAWILQDLLCATTISGQIAKLKDATPVTGRNTNSGVSNAPVFEFIEDGYGAVAHELGHAFGAPHDRRNADCCIMGNGFRGLRANFIPGIANPVAMFSDATAANISASRYLRQAANLGDATDPVVLVQAPLRVSSGTSSLDIRAQGWDAGGMYSVIHYLSLGESLIGGELLRGPLAASSAAHPLLQPFASSPATLTTTVRDTGGRIVTVNSSIAVGQGADFTLSGLGGAAPYAVTADASRTASLGGTPTAYAWNFGDGTTATGVTANKTWSTAGTYTVTLTVTYSGGATSTGSRQVRVTSGANAAPGLTVPFATSTTLDQGIGPITVTLCDDATPAATLVLTAASSDQAVVRNADITIGGSGSTRQLSLLPFGAGTTTITLTATDGAGLATTGSFIVKVRPATLPAGWRTGDIGVFSSATSANWSSNVFTVAGTGWGPNSGAGDQLRFVWQEVSGDCTIIARLDSLTPANASLAGISIRTGLGPFAAHATALGEGTSTNWNRLVGRSSDGGTTSFAWGNARGAPLWLRLVRSGSTVTASTSANGTTWDTSYNQPWTLSLPATPTVLVGLVVAQGGATQLPVASFSNVSITGGAAKLGWIVQPSAAAANAPISPAITVAVQNQGGTTLTSAPARVTLSLGTNPGGATLSGTLSAVAVNGVATFSDVRISAAGSGYTLVASTTGLPSATSAAFTIGQPNQAPVIQSVGSSGNPVLGSATGLNASASDDGGEAGLTYAWSPLSTPAGGSVSFSLNGSNAAKATTASFTRAGTYSIRLTVSDAAGATASSSLNVVVNQSLTTIALSPASCTLATGSSQAFTAIGRDQFGQNLAVQPVVAWSIDAGGVGAVTQSGVYTAPGSSGSATLRAASGAISGTAAVTVQVPLPSIAINFQPASAPAYPGYLIDAGAAYAARNGQTYGWSTALKTTALVDRNSSSSPDQRYDTHAVAGSSTTLRWELAVPAGTYDVRVVCGDPSAYANTVYKVAVEGVLTVNGTPTSTRRWLEGTSRVTVSDGRLTLTNASGAKSNKPCFVSVVPVPAAGG